MSKRACARRQRKVKTIVTPRHQERPAQALEKLAQREDERIAIKSKTREIGV